VRRDWARERRELGSRQGGSLASGVTGRKRAQSVALPRKVGAIVLFTPRLFPADCWTQTKKTILIVIVTGTDAQNEYEVG
jgi:hypothetical protein